MRIETAGGSSPGLRARRGSRFVAALAGLALGMGIVLAATPALAETVTLTPVRDATLFEDAEGAKASGSGPGLFAGNNQGSNTRRTVIFFDVEAAIPPGATVETVELRLVVDSAPTSDPQPITVHRALAPWGEGASASNGGAGAPSEPGDATWLHRFYPDSLWAAPGGDFDPAVRAEIQVGESGAHVWSSAELAQDVQAWLDESSGNHGWMLRGDETAVQTVRRFDSREDANEADRPTLTITFSTDGVPVEATSWGRVKRLGGGSD